MTPAPEHFIEVQYIGAKTYRYYGWAHLPHARCVGEGDWRIFANGREYQTNGAIVPGDVLREVNRIIAQQEAEKH